MYCREDLYLNLHLIHIFYDEVGLAGLLIKELYSVSCKKAHQSGGHRFTLSILVVIRLIVLVF